MASGVRVPLPVFGPEALTADAAVPPVVFLPSTVPAKTTPEPAATVMVSREMKPGASETRNSAVRRGSVNTLKISPSWL